MNKNQERSRTPSLRFDCSRAEEELNAVCDNACLELTQLIDKSRFQAFQEYTLVPYLRSLIPIDAHPGNSQRVQFQLRLGSTKLTLEELNRLHPNVIVPLLDSTNGQVQIWTEGRLAGHGILRIANGKLVVKIVSIEP